MQISEVRTTFDLLERTMNLPEYAKIVSVSEEDNRGVVRIRIVTENLAPEEFSFQDMSKIGDAFKEPEKYKRQADSKATVPDFKLNTN